MSRVEDRAADVFGVRGLTPRTWSSRLGFVDGTHTHLYAELLGWVAGSISLHTPDRVVGPRAGDCLDLPAGTPDVGPGGVNCWDGHPR